MTNTDTMKAWLVKNKYEFYAYVVFAETRGKARSLALSCDGLEDCEFCDIVAQRLPQADKMYNGQDYLDWSKDTDRMFLVKECGFWCGYECFDVEECKCCVANEYCDYYQDYIQEESQ